MDQATEGADADGPIGASDDNRISRRRAMQLAAAGGVAAAVWAAPKIEGFSIAPDFAAAASCASPANANTNFGTTRYAANCFWTNNCDACVNGVGGSNGNCPAGFASGVSCGNTPRTGTLSIPRNNAANVDFNYSFLGSAWNGGASLNGTLSGAVARTNCTVTLNGSCADTGGGGGCSFGTGSGATRNSATDGNGTLATGIDFNCNGTLCSENNRCNNNSITLSLTLSCICT